MVETGFELDHIELKVIERAPHVVELILSLHDDFVEAVIDCPGLLLLRERTKEPLSSPVETRPVEPLIQHLSA